MKSRSLLPATQLPTEITSTAIAKKKNKKNSPAEHLTRDRYEISKTNSEKEVGLKHLILVCLTAKGATHFPLLNTLSLSLLLIYGL